MKRKILVLNLLLVLFAFYSCEKEEHKPENTTYLDNKLIEGKWYRIFGKDSAVYTFKENKAFYELYAHISGEEKLKYEGKDSYGNYLLTDSLILLPESSEREFIYRLKNDVDSLYLQRPINNDPTYWYELKKLKE